MRSEIVLTGLPEVPTEHVRAAHCCGGGIEEMMRTLRGNKWSAVSVAGENGSLNVWRVSLTVQRTNGYKWRCEFDRYRVMVNTTTFVDLDGVEKWLKKWAPKLEYKP